MKRDVDSLIVALDYATACAGQCPTCVLDQGERGSRLPAISPAVAKNAFDVASDVYGRVGYLALGVGRANVLDLPNAVSDVMAMAGSAKAAFSPEQLTVEVSTSLVGKIDRQLVAGQKLAAAAERADIDLRFVVVANVALHQDRYWANLDTFLRAMEAGRGGSDRDGAGDVLQLSLSSRHLPPVDDLIDRIGRYRFAINLLWTPFFDAGARHEADLAHLEDWVSQFHDAAAACGLDANIVTRTRNALASHGQSIAQVVEHAREGERAVIYVGSNGAIHDGLFTILAEFDPVRYDPLSHSHNGRSSAAADDARGFARLMRNPACASCPHLGSCITGGMHRIALTTLRHHPHGTTVCPAGIRRTFDHALKAKGLLETAA